MRAPIKVSYTSGPGARLGPDGGLWERIEYFFGARPAVWCAGVLLVVAAALAYSNSLTTPLVLDDLPGLAENRTVFGALGEALRPPPNGQTVSGRPLVNLTLWLNVAGHSPSDLLAPDAPALRPFHLFNLAVHALAGLALFGVTRRTLLRPALAPQFGGHALWLALAVALLWMLHPLQTESVTYIIQRAEAMMGLFYFTTLYCFVMGINAQERADGGASGARGGGPCWRWLAYGWFALAVAACLLGVASKEVIVSAPVLALFYDRAFGAGGFAGAWHRRWGAHLALFATWIPLGWQVAATGTRGQSAGFGAGVEWWEYAGAQFGAIAQYLRLAVWPEPLVFDYGQDISQYPSPGWSVALVLALAALTVWALWRAPRAGWVGLFFFATLAPSSSVVPVVTQTWAEHRLYLALAAPVALLVAAGYRGLGARFITAAAALAVALGLLTFARNADYATAIGLWADTARKRPLNARAHNNLAISLAAAGRHEEAVPAYLEAVRLRAYYPDAHTNLGNSLSILGRYEESIRHHEEAIRQHPKLAAAYYNLGNVYADSLRQYEAARPFYEKALSLQPNNPAAHNNLGNVLARLGQPELAARHYHAAVTLVPLYPEPNFSLGTYLVQTGRAQDALPFLENALRGRPDFAEARNSYGGALMMLRRAPEAVVQFEAALRINPNLPGVEGNLGYARRMVADPRVPPPTIAPPPPGP